MVDTPQSESRLSVLNGPLAGHELVLDEDVDNILVGSDPSCRFHLPTPGVAPIHARLWMDASGVTIYDAGSDRGLFVNDDRVTGQAPLRNGDILWLGSPGDDDVVMIQCRLPVRGAATAPAAAPEETMVVVSEDETPVVEAVPAPPSVEDETAALFAIAPPEEAAAPLIFEAVSEPPVPGADAESVLEAVDDEPATLVSTRDEDFATDETHALSSPLDSQATEVAPLTPGEPAQEAPVTFALDYEDPQAPAFVTSEAPAPVFEDETEAPTMMVTPPVHDATVAMPFTPPEPTIVAPPPPVVTEAPIPTPPPPSPPPKPPAPVAARPPKPRPTPTAPKPPRQEPAPSPAPVRKEAGAPVGRYAAMGVGGLVLLGVLGYAGMRFMGGKATPASTPTPVAPPTTMAMAALPAATLAPAPPPTTLAAKPLIDEGVTVVKAPPPTTLAAAPSPGATRTPAPTPTPAATTKATQPAAATPPPGPSAEAVHAQQVTNLLGQADAAAGAHSYDQAAGLYDEVLKLDPGNAKASGGKSAALASAVSFKKSFVSGKTSVSSGKAAKGSLSGFDSEDVSVAKAPDYSGRIEFEVSPSHVKPGDSYAARIFLTNDGKKSFKIGSLAVTTTTNGNKAGGPAAAAVKEVQPQQRVSLQETTGTWQDGTTSWNLEAAVVSDHGDSFKNTVTWR